MTAAAPIAVPTTDSLPPSDLNVLESKNCICRSLFVVVNSVGSTCKNVCATPPEPVYAYDAETPLFPVNPEESSKNGLVVVPPGQYPCKLDSVGLPTVPAIF